MKKQIKFLEGSKIYLRPHKEEDLDIIEFGKNNPDVRDTLFLFDPQTRNDVEHEVKTWLNDKSTVLFTICENKTNQPVGQTALFRIDYVSRAAIFYIAIYDPVFWSKGYGKETTELMLKYSFDILNLNRIQLHVSVENKKGVKAYEKNGFKIEGTLREAMYHNNRYVDFYVMGILRSEYYLK
jgi:RimJ/RimL family protein N-acetyltransferase